MFSLANISANNCNILPLPLLITIKFYPPILPDVPLNFIIIYYEIIGPGKESW